MIRQQVAPFFRSLESLLRNAGPYLLLELIMPGGTVLGLLLFYWQRRRGSQAIRRDVQRVLWRLMQLWNKLVPGSNPGAIARMWRNVGEDG